MSIPMKRKNLTMEELTFFTLFVYGLCGLCGVVSLWCVGWGLGHLFEDPADTEDPGDSVEAIRAEHERLWREDRRGSWGNEQNRDGS